MREADLDRADDWFDRYGGVVGPVGTAVTVALVLGAVAFAVWWRRRRQR